MHCVLRPDSAAWPADGVGATPEVYRNHYSIFASRLRNPHLTM
jgi:hypothetical protein